MTITPPRHALIVCESALFDQIPVLAATLRRRYGVKITFISPSNERNAEVSRWCGEGDEVISHSEIEKGIKAQRPGDADLHARIEAIETRHGITLVRDCIMQDRQYAGRMLGYADYDPHSFQVKESYEEILASIVGYFEYWGRLLDSRSIEFVFGKTGSLSSTALVHQAILRKIPVSILVHTRFGTAYTWASDAYLGNAVIRETWLQTPFTGELPPLPDRPLAEISERNMASAERWRGTKTLVKNLAMTTFDRIVWRLGDVVKGRWSKRLPYYALCRKHIATWHMFRQLDDLSEQDVKKITARPYVLFLLSLEPEYTTLTLAKEFNNTEATVRQLAQCLPAGMRLVVKEHVTNIGNRASNFYERLLRIPNVVLADYRLTGVALARHAEAIAAISGTIGIEGSLMGKDIISFSSRTEYAFLPNVHVVRSFHDLVDVVRRAVRQKSPEEVLRIRQDAARYQSSVKSLSYEMPQGREMGGTGVLDQAEADKAVDVLLKVIDSQRKRYAAGERIDQPAVEHPLIERVASGGHSFAA